MVIILPGHICSQRSMIEMIAQWLVLWAPGSEWPGFGPTGILTRFSGVCLEQDTLTPCSTGYMSYSGSCGCVPTQLKNILLRC